ncbi:MAG: putative membrane protein YhiD involved in acid resistance [Flavobacteriaceae bacterium]|jgi:uncharacterized membrane protein YhiD involved in acid resistance|uniref:DUF4956 domain-containing protein n=1 Tax=Candidatus Marifrigoribacter sp. Uisw_064 TaxID=3230970 RepID=UPI003AE8F261
MFDLSSLTNNLEGSSIVNIIVIALVSFVLSSLIALTYERTSREIERPQHFIQSLILISIPVATVMQAIGDSLARGLGMLGALAIIRFRTTLRNPRNMVFMFTSISVGIAAGVYGIAIAVVGTLGFCLVVTVIHFSPLSKNDHIIGTLQFEISNANLLEGNMGDRIIEILESYCKKVSLSKYRINNKKKSGEIIQMVVFEYKINIDSKHKSTQMVNTLLQEHGIFNVRINFRDDHEKI